MKTVNFMLHRILFLFSWIGGVLDVSLVPSIHGLFNLRRESTFSIGKTPKSKRNRSKLCYVSVLLYVFAPISQKNYILNNEFKMCFGCVSFHPTAATLIYFIESYVCRPLEQQNQQILDTFTFYFFCSLSLSLHFSSALFFARSTPRLRLFTKKAFHYAGKISYDTFPTHIQHRHTNTHASPADKKKIFI